MLAATAKPRSKPAGRSQSVSLALLANTHVDIDWCDRIAHSILKSITMNEENTPLQWEL